MSNQPRPTSRPTPRQQPAASHYIISLRPLPNHPNTPARRLARLLKLTRRHFGLECVECRESPRPASPPDAG